MRFNNQKYLLVGFFILVFLSPIFSQTNTQPTRTVSFIADSLFTAGDYSAALTLYERLLERFPQEPDYHYRLGVCYLEASREVDKAIKYLRFASTRQVPVLVYYYLGLAHQRNYQFNDAISYYRRYVLNGGDPKVSNKDIELLVSQCENGNFMLRYIYEPKILDTKRVPLNELHNYISTAPSKGSFYRKPTNLKTQLDVRKDEYSLIYYPANPQPGDRIIYSSYGATTSFGKDLFMIEMLPNGIWSLPKDLGEAINTNQDEDFPYLAPDGVTLHYASKGHYSMGGYDIYRSVYNPQTKKWSTPENLGFPFSSTYDDILYVPDEEGKMAIVVTNRNTLSDSVDVVLVNIDPNPIRRAIDSRETILRIAQLGTEPTMLLADRPAFIEIPKLVEETFEHIDSVDTTLVDDPVQLVEHPKPVQVVTVPRPVEPIKQPTKAARFSVVEDDPEYARALAQGFEEQMKADSLRVRLEALRARFDFIYTADDRRALERQVVAVEDALLAAQRNADIHFARASQIEQDYLTGRRKPADKPTATFSSDKPEFLYQAQFAPTVFQGDELNSLAQLERLTQQVERLRTEVIGLREKVIQLEVHKGEPDFNADEYNSTYSRYISRLNIFNTTLANHILGKKKHYNDVISVALMKAGANNNKEIRGEIDRANTHFRSATAIRNNISEETRVESEFEALLLDELGVLRLELAFAKLWGMRLFEQQVLSKLYKLEQNIFGHTLPQVQVRPTIHQPQPQVEQPQQPAITRVEERPVQEKIIEFEPEKEPSFQVVDKSPYDANNPIPKHDPNTPGVVYKIQLAAFSNPVRIDFFKNMIPISAEPVSGGKVTKYYVGNFRTFAEAEKALSTVRSRGFKDAFIVAWHDGRSVAPSRAQTLENSRPAARQQETVRIDMTSGDKLYVIQLGSFTGRLPEDIAQTIRALAPGKDVIRKPDSQGGFIYSVGSYSDLNEVNRVKDNLVASGIKNAFVVAVEVDN